MNRYLTWLLLLGIVFAVDVKEKIKKKFTVTGVVQNSTGEGIKKVKLTIINEEGKAFFIPKSKITLGEHEPEPEPEEPVEEIKDGENKLINKCLQQKN